MLDLFKKYAKWIDDSIFDGLDDDETIKKEEELERIYGLPHVLKPDAPKEAVEAWKENCRLTREAKAKGMDID